MPDSNLSTPTPDTGACADPTLPDHPVGNVLDILQRSARELGAAANELAEQPPTIALFSAVEKLTADILKLREPALDAAAQETIDALLADLATYLSEKSKTATWLVAKAHSIMAEWRSAYPLQGGNLPDELRASIRRAKRNFDRQLERCAVAYAQERDAKDALDLHDSAMDAKGVPARADLELLDRRSDDHSAARKAVYVARRDAIDALAPTSSALPATSQPTGVPVDTATPVAPRETAHVSYDPSHAAPPDSLNEAGGDSSRQTLSAAPPENEVRDPDRDRPSGGPSTAPPDSRDHSPQTVPTEEPTSAAGSAQDTPPEEAGHDNALRPAQAAVWDAVGSGRLGLAYQIALADQTVEGRVDQPSPELLAVVALGTVVRGPYDDVAHEFGRRIGDQTGCLDFGNVDQSTGDALNLLLFAASLFPALFASQPGGSIPLLRCVELSDGLTPVFRLAGAVARHAEKLQTIRLDLPTLTAILDEGAWKDRIAKHADEVARWRSSTTVAKFLYAPAGAVWKHWLRDGGILAELDRLLSTDEAAHVVRVRQIVDQLADKRFVDDLIKNTDRKEIRRRGRTITGRALSQFQSRLAEPLALARDWLRLIEAKPGGAGFVEGIVEEFQRDINDHVPVARDTIQKLQRASPAVPLASALCCALQAIESLDGIFRRKQEGDGNVAIGPVQALSDDLLFVPGLRVDSRGTIPESIPPARSRALMVDADAHAKTLMAAFDLRLQQNDLLGAHAVLTRMAAEDDPAEDACQDRLNRAVAESRGLLQLRLYDVTDKLEQAFINGQVSEDQRADLTASIAETSRRVEHREQALMAANDVAAIEAHIEPCFTNAIATVKAQLDEYLPLSDSREQALVQHALNTGDLTILHEQIDCLKSGQPLRSADAGGLSRLLSLLEVVDQIAAELDGTAGPSHDALVRAAADREDILGLKFSALAPAQSQRSADLLDVWYRMARQRSVDPDLVSQFFAGLGFTITDDSVQVRTDASIVLRTEPLRARELCPAYSFGSDARGRYKVVLNWNASSRESIIQVVGSTPHARTFVLHFGKLAKADREWLSRWSIQNSVQFITIDETLVLYLASLPDGALRALFDCTLPFTCVEPFFTAAGLVPPESFFGRGSEHRTISESSGSCFVYGGRQLGKTALLNNVQDAFHNPTSRRLAHYLDLKVHDIGIGHGADHIWKVLWKVFGQLGVIDTEQKMPRGHDSLVNAIASAVTGWLDQEDHGGILLLLDEADFFLADDLKNDFRVSTRLKGLMDETQRKFKVVLCGLHNVLRNTERANHPLAHFGEPVCVGPLLGNGDLQQARALIREPMAAAGYTFENENLLTKILVWTNYYPSLIQLYGEALLRYLRQAPGRDIPYTITSEDIQAVFNRDQFGDYIRDRFSLTLQLDPRYEVIAYAMAYLLLQDEDEPNILSGELRSTDIRQGAEDAWPDGFEISDKEFDTLLHEMCGLGVLRKRSASSGRSSYVFRNPNVLRLLGDTENILEILSKDRGVPEVFEASAFHAQYPQGKPQSAQRGPLTYEQEALLKRGGRVAVLSGTRAANHNSVKGFLSQRMEERHLRPLNAAVNDKVFRKKLTALRPDRGTISLVHDEDPWTMRWIEEASNALKKIKRGKALRVVFLANPDQLWRFVSDLPDEYLCEPNGLFDWVAVQPWNTAFLRRWCSDQNLHEATAKIDELLNATGGWPLLLERYAKSAKKKWKAKASELQSYVTKNRKDLLEALGLGSAMVRSQLAPMRECVCLTEDDYETYVELLVDEGLHTFTLDVLRRRLWWATQLGLLQDDHGALSLNPLVDRILTDDSP